MIHEMKLNPEPFNLIKNGSKIFELRLFDEKRQQLKIDDQINFENTDHSKDMLSVEIVDLHRFASFEELYQALPLLKCGYTAATIESADPSDMMVYYSKAQLKKYGVVAIEIKIKQKAIDIVITTFS